MSIACPISSKSLSESGLECPSPGMSIPPDDWPRVRAVFEHALTLPPSARSEYVASACGGGTSIRQQVERLLTSHEQAAGSLETPLAVSLTGGAVATDLEGRQIGPYQLGARIGAGGMGEVYRARDTRLGRAVAVKVLPSHVANDPRARERFNREARAIATLNHPHICVLHDVGEATVPAEASPGGDRELATVRYLVMELLQGETLAARLTRGPLPVDEALQYAVEIASALNRAHHAGIIHRDLKPGNIFLVSTGGTSPAFTAKLLDFGLAKEQTAPAQVVGRRESPGEAVTMAADLTAPGIILGTVQYMAPEQIEGGETDARTDVFAFGLVLFEMLTGRKAFEADSRRSLMVAILDRDPPPLSTLQPAAPQWVERLVRRCLAKNPDDRWQTGKEVLLELQARGASPASVPSAADRARSDAERHVEANNGRGRWSARAAAIALSLAAVIAGSILVTRLGVGPTGNPSNEASASVQRASIAVLPIRSDSPETEAANLGVGIADAIVTRLANVRSIRVRPTSAIMSLQGRTIDAVAVGRQLQVDHVLTGTVRRSGDAYRFSLQLIRATDDSVVWGSQIDVNQRNLFTIEDQVSAEVVSALQLQITSTERARLTQPSTQNPDAYSEYLHGRALMANYSPSNLRQAMDHFERALQIDRNFGLAHAGLAMAAGHFSVRFAYEQRQAADWGRRAEEYAARALKQDSNLAEAHLAVAIAAGTIYRNFDWATVIREAQVALTLNPNLDLAHSAMARAFYHLGLLDWSEVESKRADEISGGTNLEVSRVHLYNQLLSGHFAEARQMAETLMRRNDVPVIRQYLGLSLFYLGDRGRAQEILANVLRENRPDTRSQASLAGVLAANGRRDEAEKTIRAVVESGYMDHHVAYALGAAEAQLRHPAEAVKWLRSAAETGFPCYEWMVRDSLLDPIRSEPRFQAFLTTLRADYDRARTRYEAVSRVP
jgi:serine/threonine protein kinase/tetratricopeptide (TPR) repeat protein